MSWYNTGTVNIVKGSKNVNGVGTKWVSNVRVGEGIQIGTSIYEIENVASDGAMSLATPVTEATGTGKTYRIIPFQGYVKQLADKAARLLYVVEEQTSDFGNTILNELGDAPDKTVSQAKITSELEWAQTTIPKEEAQAGTATTRRAWSALRVREAIVAWFNGVSGTIGRTILGRNTATQVRDDLGLGTAATRDVGESSGNVMRVGAFGLGLASSQYKGDLNDLKTTQMTGVLNGVNAPSVGIGALSVISYSNDWVAQVYHYPGEDDKYWIRSFYNGKAWSQWKSISHSGNILTTTGQSTLYPMTQKAVTTAINGVSDRRDKLDITSSGVGLDLIEKLEPVSFRLNKRDWYRNQAATSVETHTDEDGTQTEAEKIDPDVISKPLTDYDDNDGSLARDDKYTGLIAQDVKAALEDLGLGDLAIIKNYSDEYEDGEDRHYIEYNGLIPVMINAIKELSARVKELEDRD